MPRSSNPTSFTNLNAALNALGSTEAKTSMESAVEDLETAESVETMGDFKANFDAALANLRNAVSEIERLRARC